MGVICLIAILVYFLFNSTNLIDKSTDTFMVENGTLSYEESADGYIIRDEKILKGNNYANGLSQIITDGSRVSKGEAVFRYYSSNEDEINSQIAELDKQIDDALESNQNNILPTIDSTNLENEIKKVLSDLYEENNIQLINEYKKRLNSYVVKKAEISGENSEAGSYIRTLIEQRKNLSNQLTNNSETIVTDTAGIISYRVDGLEDILTLNNGDFSYLSKELLDSFNLNVGSAIPESKEAGKIVNNFECYIACPINTENSETAEVRKYTNIKAFRFNRNSSRNSTNKRRKQW